MIKGIVYFLVIIIANTVGAVSGMGGGVIIKPVLDLVGWDTVVTVSFYSTVAVFVMSIVSTTRQLKNGVVLDFKKVIWIALGSILGGYIGNITFEYLFILFQQNADLVKLCQIILTIAVLIFSLLASKDKFKSLHLVNPIWFLMCGLLLGFLSSLLGIGGGPINVSLLMLLFSLPIKLSTVYSICIIFFSQLSKIITIAFSTGFDRYDMSLLIYIIAAAICGGLMGAKLSGKLSENKVTLIFQYVIMIVLLINVYNMVRIFY